MSKLVKPMTSRHAAAAARLHQEGINTGFLSSLGRGFLRQLYAAIPSVRSGFGYVWEEPDGTVLGFIACSETTKRLYKQAIIRRGLLMGLAMVPRVVRHPSVIKRIWETLCYPGEADEQLPSPEVLSIAVDASARGKGVGRALMEAAFAEFRRRGVLQIKVAVGSTNEAANVFYQQCGFSLAVTREHHGLPMNIYTVDLST